MLHQFQQYGEESTFMKCKKCGNEVDIGEVFCQKCGTAIQIVPEYNPLEDELEASVEMPHNQFTEELNRSEEIQEPEEKKQGQLQIQKKRRQKQLLLCSILLFFLIGGIAVGTTVYLRYQEEHSFAYQYQQGMFYEAKEEYEIALNYYAEAMNYDKSNTDVRLRAAGVYEKLGNYDRTQELLLEVINLKPTIETYRKLMEVCEASGNTELMNRVLKDTQGTPIGDALSEYQTAIVSANIPTGEYHDYLTVYLTASEENATIYYTLDGSAPTQQSNQYTEPLEIETVGRTTLRAIAYNEADLAGEEWKAVYEITLVNPEAPKISPVSGTYSYGEKITLEAQEGSTAYFTIDGTIPTKENGYIFTEDIAMPIGNVIFSAIVIDRYGMVSSVTKRNYTCTINRPFGYDAAIIKLKNYLVEIGMMSDLNGNRANDEKISVEFVSLTEVDGQESYIFTLRRTASGKTTTLNDKLYAVTTQKGDVYALNREMEGIYHFVVEQETTVAEETTVVEETTAEKEPEESTVEKEPTQEISE